LAGDYNSSHAVDAADYVLWRKTFGTMVAEFSGADGSGNGFIDQADYDVWRANFGNTLPPPSSGSTAIAATAFAEPIAHEQAALAASAAPAARTLADPIPRAVQRLTSAVDSVVQAPNARSHRPHLERRDLPTVAASQDNALIAWLAFSPRGVLRELAAAELDDVLSETDGRDFPDKLLDALDLAFASLGSLG
jgi:hypothetical protein